MSRSAGGDWLPGHVTQSRVCWGPVDPGPPTCCGILFALALFPSGLFLGCASPAGLSQQIQVPFAPGLAVLGSFAAFDAESQVLAFLVLPLAVIPAVFLAFRTVLPGMVVLLLALPFEARPGLWRDSGVLSLCASLSVGLTLVFQALSA